MTDTLDAGFQQWIWWVYDANDYITSTQLTIRVTGPSGTGWSLKRSCPVVTTTTTTVVPTTTTTTIAPTTTTTTTVAPTTTTTTTLAPVCLPLVGTGEVVTVIIPF